METIVFIACHNHFRDWAGKSYYDLITYIRENNKKNKIVIYWNDGNIKEIQNEIKNIKPKMIVFFETTKLKDNKELFFVFDLGIPVGVCLLDIFNVRKTSNDKGIKKTDFIIHFSESKSFIRTYQRIFPQKYLGCFNSRFINVERFKDYKLPKIYDILLYGTRTYNKDYKNEKLDSIQNYIKRKEQNNGKKIQKDEKIDFYPLRVKLEKILNQLSTKYCIKILPEVCIDKAVIANEDLSRLINQSHLTVSCCTIADIMMHKYLEIGASKSVILGNIPSDYNNFFKNDMIEVNEFMTDEMIINKIDDALQNKTKLKEMSDRLYKKIQEQHNFDKALINFNQTFDNVFTYMIKRK